MQAKALYLVFVSERVSYTGNYDDNNYPGNYKVTCV